MKLSDLAAVQRLLRPLKNGIANMVSRGVCKLVDDSKKFQSMQLLLLEGEVRNDVEHVGNYGFTSVPKPPNDDGAPEVVTVHVGGKRGHSVVIACGDRRYRLKGLEDGEVAMYTDQNDKIVMKRDGHIELTASTKVLITCPLVETTAKLKVGGVLEVIGNATVGGTLGVTGVLTGSTINATEISDGGKVLGTHTHPVSLTGGTTSSSCTSGGATGTTGGSVTSGAPT